ncbi:hypothetical protein [Actinoallomurus sp. CA-142502]|uniref:hypothetical protein n=1 Tax=Actinoallomurus sp. CA-142502 TaxID=3239885 RepID=UPI003D8F14D6
MRNAGTGATVKVTETQSLSGGNGYIVVGAAQGFQNTFPVSSWLGIEQKTLAQEATATTDT